MSDEITRRMLDLIMPNGKRLADCNGTEVAEMGSCLSWLGHYFWTNQTTSKCLTCGKQFVVTSVAQLECEDCEGDPTRRHEKRARELEEIGRNLRAAEMAMLMYGLGSAIRSKVGRSMITSGRSKFRR